MEASVADPQEHTSDYGSDFTPDEEDVLTGLLQRSPLECDNPITDPDLQLKDVQDEITPKGARVRVWGNEQLSTPTKEKKRVTISLHGDDGQATNREIATTSIERERSVSIEAPLDPPREVPDLRSPLERFRSKPRRTLSVTDLISPSWCELQYWYILTKHGRKRSTPAMKKGSAIHKTLEEEVHQTVPVDITSKEDAWGLRIWNVIQGLKTLRETGMTRELEIWGTVNGLVVNGVIDELSYVCPDQRLSDTEKSPKANHALPADQATISDFYGGSTIESDKNNVFRKVRSRREAQKVYLIDVKTRTAKSIPKGASFRPTVMQLMLYRLLLSDLVTNKVNADTVFERFSLNSDAQFSDSFVAQIGSLNQTFDDLPSSSETDSPPSTQDSMTVLLAHNSLRSLWTFMISEFAHTMPAGVDSIGNVLKAEYRSAVDGEIMGANTFLYDGKKMHEYLEDEVKWWKGERSAQGVCVEEAYKCGSCEFHDECGWRKNKIEEATEKMRRSRSRV